MLGFGNQGMVTQGAHHDFLQVPGLNASRSFTWSSKWPYMVMRPLLRKIPCRKRKIHGQGHSPPPPTPPKPLAEQPGNPANKLGAWCRSSPGGGTNFQNPNFKISSILALLACLRRFGTLKKNVIPDFTSILALLAYLRRFGTLKKN